MTNLLPIEISRESGGWKVWFGTWTTDRARHFATPEEAEAFARKKFASMKRRHILYPRDWPLKEDQGKATEVKGS